MLLFIFEKRLHVSSLLSTGSCKLSHAEEQLRPGAVGGFSNPRQPLLPLCLPKKHSYAAWPRRAFVRGGRREGTAPRPPGTRRAATQPNAFSDLFRITSPHLEVFWTLSIFSLGLSIDERNMFRADSLGRFLPPNAETQCFLAGSPPGRALQPATKGPLVRQQQRSIFNTNYFRPQNNGSFCARSSAFPRQTMYHSRKDRR